MAFNRDATVSSSQNEVLEGAHGSSSISDTLEKQKNLSMNPHLKMVAKVFPTVRKEDKPESDDEVTLVDDGTFAKKQAFPWLCKFSTHCGNAAGSRSYERLDELMDIYIRSIYPDVKSCYKKPVRSSKLKARVNDSLKFFHMMYKDIRRPVEIDCFFDRMSDLLAMHLDLELTASRRGMENPRKISARLLSALFIFLDNSMSHILNAILKARFFVKLYHEICIPIIRGVLKDAPADLDAVSFIQYLLVFRKWKALIRAGKEKRQISLMAAKQLTPPPGFVDEYYTSDKYIGLLPVIPRAKRENFTFALMQALEPNPKGTTEGYVSTVEGDCDPDKLLENAKPKESVLNEEQHFLYPKIEVKNPNRCKLLAREIWLGLGQLSDNKNHLMDEVHEEEFFRRLKKQNDTLEKEKQEQTSKRVVKTKKYKEEEENNGIGKMKRDCVSSSTPRKTAECYGFATSTQNTIKNETAIKPEYNLENAVINESRLKAKEVSKMEADSQSQDVDLIKKEDVSTPLKIETQILLEEHEAFRREILQTSVLRAVVRPENIEQLSLNEKELVGRNQCLGGKKIEVCESSNRSQEVQVTGKEQEVDETRGGECQGPILVQETLNAKSVVDSSVDVQCSSSEQSKPSSKLFFEDFSRLPTTSSGGLTQLLNGAEGQNHQLGPFLLGGNFISQCSSDKTVDSQHSPNSHDIFPVQFDSDSDLMAQYEIGNTNEFQDFFNDQSMVLIEAALELPGVKDLTKDDDPEELLRTTHWGEWSMMVSDATNSLQDNSTSTLEVDTTPVVPEQDCPVSVSKSRQKTKKKKLGTNIKDKDSSPTRKELPQINEKINKVIPVKEVKVTKKGKQAWPSQKGKRGLISAEVEEGTNAVPEPELELEPLPKKKRGRRKKTPPPLIPRPSRLVSPRSPRLVSPPPTPRSPRLVSPPPTSPRLVSPSTSTDKPKPQEKKQKTSTPPKKKRQRRRRK